MEAIPTLTVTLSCSTRRLVALPGWSVRDQKASNSWSNPSSPLFTANPRTPSVPHTGRCLLRHLHLHPSRGLRSLLYRCGPRYAPRVVRPGEIVPNAEPRRPHSPYSRRGPRLALRVSDPARAGPHPRAQCRRRPLRIPRRKLRRPPNQPCPCGLRRARARRAQPKWAALPQLLSPPHADGACRRMSHATSEPRDRDWETSAPWRGCVPNRAQCPSTSTEA